MTKEVKVLNDWMQKDEVALNKSIMESDGEAPAATVTAQKY